MTGHWWRRLDGFSRLFLFFAMIHVAGEFVGRALIPYAGALATVALAGVIWGRPRPKSAAPWTKPVLLAGLALLATVLDLPERTGFAAEAGTTAACGLIAAGVLGRVRFRRWSAVASAVFAVVVVLAARSLARDPVVRFWEEPPDTSLRLLAVTIPALAAVLAGVAAIGALSSPGGVRWAGAGLLPVVVLAIAVLPALLDEEGLAPRHRPVDVQAVLRTDLFRYEPLYPPPAEVPLSRDPAAVPPAPDHDWSPVTTARAVARDITETPTDPGAAIKTALILLGLATMTTALFPFRE